MTWENRVKKHDIFMVFGTYLLKMDNVANRYIFYVDIDINTSKILHSYPMATIWQNKQWVDDANN